MNYSDLQIWIIIAVLGIGTFLIRFSFLGLIGNRELPEWLLRHLRYTAVTILPAMVAPLILWPEGIGGAVDLVRVSAALVALAIAYLLKMPIPGIIAGVAVYAGLGVFL